jgi:hypothetical protein
MPAANIAAQAGEAQIRLFEFHSDFVEPVDVSSGSIELNYYESILDTTVRVTATFVDTGYRFDKESGNTTALKSENIDGASVNLKISDGYDNEIKFMNDNQLRIESTRNMDDARNKQIFTVDMTSKEYDDNLKLKCSVVKSYDGKIDESVKKILLECIKTEKNIDVDQTLNNFNFSGKSQTPFYICTWLATRSVPDMQDANQNLAGYFFYETSEGYKFKSIDKLFLQKPKRILIYNDLIGDIPPGYDGKILDYSFDKTFNLRQLRQTGALGQTQLRSFNLYDNKYEESEFNYTNQYKEENNGGTRPIRYGNDQDETSLRFFSIKDFGVKPSGSVDQQLEKSRDTLNFNVDDIMRQSTMRYNSLYAVKLSITISGDINLRAGDLVHCDFPQVSGESLRTVSMEKSGIYMIHDLCHRITKNGCYTRLNLVRDSIGRKPF